MEYTIWTNDINYDDWKADMEEQYPASEGYTENDRINFMYEINDEYLNDEMDNLSIDLYSPILVIGELGLWNGRKNGHRFLSGTKLNSIFSSACGDFVTWYVKDGEIKCKDVHHDGTNNYTYRVLKDINQYEFEEYICEHSFEEAVKKYTAPLGHYVDEIYGVKDENI